MKFIASKIGLSFPTVENQINVRLRFLLLCVFFFLFTACTTNTSSNPGGLENAPSSPADVYVKLGKQYIARGSLRTALGELKHALAIDSNNSEAHNTIAILYERLGKEDLAGDHYKKAVTLFPNNSSAQNNYGRHLCVHSNNYVEAQEHFKLSYENPLYEKPWFPLTNAGSCALNSGKLEEAETLLRESLQVNRKFPPTLLEMSKLNLKKQNFLSARAFLQRYESVSKPTSDSLWIGVQTERKLNNEKNVDDYAKQLLATFPNSEEAGLYRSSQNP